MCVCALYAFLPHSPGHPRSCGVINHFGTFDAKENRRATNIRLFAYQRSNHAVEFAILQVAPAGSLRHDETAKKSLTASKKYAYLTGYICKTYVCMKNLNFLC